MCLFIFTDGARRDRDGGWAFVAVKNAREIHRDNGQCNHTTSQRMELTAILKALAWSHHTPGVDNVIIVTDSQYAISVLTRQSLDSMPRRDVHTQDFKNKDLICQARSLITPAHKFQWVKGHNGNHWNECADQLATSAVRGIPASRVFLPRPSPHGDLYGLLLDRPRKVPSKA